MSVNNSLISSFCNAIAHAAQTFVKWLGRGITRLKMCCGTPKKTNEVAQQSFKSSVPQSAPKERQAEVDGDTLQESVLPFKPSGAIQVKGILSVVSSAVSELE